MLIFWLRACPDEASIYIASRYRVLRAYMTTLHFYRTKYAPVGTDSRVVLDAAMALEYLNSRGARA